MLSELESSLRIPVEQQPQDGMGGQISHIAKFGHTLNPQSIPGGQIKPGFHSARLRR
jgi:hypothetical protein